MGSGPCVPPRGTPEGDGLLGIAAPLCAADIAHPSLAGRDAAEAAGEVAAGCKCGPPPAHPSATPKFSGPK